MVIYKVYIIDYSCGLTLKGPPDQLCHHKNSLIMFRQRFEFKCSNYLLMYLPFKGFSLCCPIHYPWVPPFTDFVTLYMATPAFILVIFTISDGTYSTFWPL